MIRLLQLVRQAATVYAVLMLIYFVLPYVTSNQRPWMVTLSRICAPGVRAGNQLAARLFPDKHFKIDVAPLLTVLACWVIKWVLGWFV